MREHDQPDQRAAHAGNKRKGLRTAGRVSMPTSGCSSDAVSWKVSVIRSDLREIETIG